MKAWRNHVVNSPSHVLSWLALHWTPSRRFLRPIPQLCVFDQLAECPLAKPKNTKIIDYTKDYRHSTEERLTARTGHILIVCTLLEHYPVRDFFSYSIFWSLGTDLMIPSLHLRKGPSLLHERLSRSYLQPEPLITLLCWFQEHL